MADDHEAQGIKLFGTTIAVKDILHEKPHELPTKSDQPTEQKRPEKIIPCPRCKSMETKFCYFNNYNVNQPRHFCKGCQRYWTAGGALRNVPVGAGRRKNKPPCQGFSESNCFFDIGSGVQEIDFDGMVEGWQVAVQDGFHHVFPAKRRRSTTAGGGGGGGGQSC